ncbi:hypothetical protein [Schleiferilactobacillus harbinensis]|uniref:hypothetical protein n=1 Tax=Schleiferilactobacillus harbinensis TaxID=304207 RepID=UPI00116E8C58|nr:hypothetical protein [Schleiferilactobacillus harbinensis]GEK06161.1 hypothetical protein LHA01_14000 [Schleiferilactobacillus harbinensis]
MTEFKDLSRIMTAKGELKTVYDNANHVVWSSIISSGTLMWSGRDLFDFSEDHTIQFHGNISETANKGILVELFHKRGTGDDYPIKQYAYQKNVSVTKTEVNGAVPFLQSDVGTSRTLLLTSYILNSSNGIQVFDDRIQLTGNKDFPYGFKIIVTKIIAA